MMRERRDRRRWERRDLEAPCKLLHTPSGRYLLGRTRNLSLGGALLVLDIGRPLLPGEPLELGIAIEPKGLLPRGAMRPARVVWADLSGEGQRLALEFERPG